jgi:hypothetical protein
MKETEKLLEVALKTTSKVAQAYVDKKISTGEAIGIALVAIGFVGAFKRVGIIEQEMKNFNAKEDIPGLVTMIDKQLILPNKETETKIKNNVKIIAEIAMSTFGGEALG